MGCFLNSSSWIFCFANCKLVLNCKIDGSQIVKSTNCKSYPLQMYIALCLCHCMFHPASSDLLHHARCCPMLYCSILHWWLLRCSNFVALLGNGRIFNAPDFSRQRFTCLCLAASCFTTSISPPIFSLVHFSMLHTVLPLAWLIHASLVFALLPHAWLVHSLLL